ncbi:MAG: peptidoglycan DD-metalloendopeptidase family protein [Leptospirales bacterium]|nr:peptidoglycan DD-metalloendopeptidase family protein [Leptospirales bacterium]
MDARTDGVEYHNGRWFKEIQEIIPGDIVLSYNESTQAVEPKRVVQTFVRQTDRIYHVRYSNGAEFETTFNHEFYVKDAGWVQAKQLRAGDVSLLANGGERMIAGVNGEARYETVYNFEVQDNHSYFVGRDAVLVHNLAYSLSQMHCNSEGRLCMTAVFSSHGPPFMDLGSHQGLRRLPGNSDGNTEIWTDGIRTIVMYGPPDNKTVISAPDANGSMIISYHTGVGGLTESRPYAIQMGGQFYQATDNSGLNFVCYDCGGGASQQITFAEGTDYTVTTTYGDGSRAIERRADGKTAMQMQITADGYASQIALFEDGVMRTRIDRPDPSTTAAITYKYLNGTNYYQISTALPTGVCHPIQGCVSGANVLSTQSGFYRSNGAFHGGIDVGFEGTYHAMLPGTVTGVGQGTTWNIDGEERGIWLGTDGKYYYTGDAKTDIEYVPRTEKERELMAAIPRDQMSRAGTYMNVASQIGGRTYTITYAHMQPNFEVGEVVAPGAELGQIGETGRATGPHAHISVRIPRASLPPGIPEQYKNGEGESVLIDPMYFFTYIAPRGAGR